MSWLIWLMALVAARSKQSSARATARLEGRVVMDDGVAQEKLTWYATGLALHAPAQSYPIVEIIRLSLLGSACLSDALASFVSRLEQMGERLSALSHGAAWMVLNRQMSYLTIVLQIAESLRARADRRVQAPHILTLSTGSAGLTDHRLLDLLVPEQVSCTPQDVTYRQHRTTGLLPQHTSTLDAFVQAGSLLAFSCDREVA